MIERIEAFLNNHTIFDGLLPFVTRQLEMLVALRFLNAGIYRDCLSAVTAAQAVLQDPTFRRLHGYRLADGAISSLFGADTYALVEI